MLAVTSLPPLIWRDSAAADDVDELATQFLQLESRAAEAYRQALAIDEQSETMRERLILAVEQFGVVNGHHALAGARYELVIQP